MLYSLKDTLKISKITLGGAKIPAIGIHQGKPPRGNPRGNPHNNPKGDEWDEQPHRDPQDEPVWIKTSEDEVVLRAARKVLGGGNP